MQPQGSGRPRKYCSSECCRGADRDNKRIKYVGKRQTNCELCGAELPKNKTRFCSGICKSRYNAIKQGLIEDHGELTKVCPVCGKEFKTWKSGKITCSKVCSDRMHSQKADRRYRGRTIDHDITLHKLAERDKNQCQICGLYVDWQDIRQDGKSTVCGMMYPSIDHITPISMGGMHSWDNVQLAHRICNSRKGNKCIG